MQTDTQLETQLSIYTFRHSQPVRDVAEVIDLATRHGGCAILTYNGDDCDPRASVFREAIDLYQQKHGINAAHVKRALTDWQAMAD